jgi:hypothetical protein
LVWFGSPVPGLDNGQPEPCARSAGLTSGRRMGDNCRSIHMPTSLGSLNVCQICPTKRLTDSPDRSLCRFSRHTEKQASMRRVCTLFKLVSPRARLTAHPPTHGALTLPLSPSRPTQRILQP